MKQFLLLLFLLTTGCSIPRSEPEGGLIQGKTINPSGKVLILAVRDGQEQDQPAAPGSGQGMVNALRKVLMDHFIPFSTTEHYNNIQGFEEAEKLNFDYVLKCTITLWENNATAWSGNGDKLKISIEIFDVKSKQLVAIAGHYRVATGATLATGTPDRFMNECALGALSKIYAWPTK